MLLDMDMDLPTYETSLEAQSIYSDPLITDEANNNEIIDNAEIETSNRRWTPLQEFYADQSIFVTGATGFLGKILVEKLLRSCPNISKIYVLVRPKKGMDVQSRMEAIFNDPMYDRLKEQMPKFRHKIVPIAGDCSVPALGLSASNRALLLREVSIVFHVAATVRFDEKLKLATAINIRSTGDILDICKYMPKLKSLIHVSTAYANCHLQEIGEKFYNYPIKYDGVCKLTETLPESTIDDITPRLLGQWPNTYAFTKAIAEDLIKEKNKGLPMGMFRPGIVVSTAEEPLSGWIDNIYGPTGVVTGASTGLLRTLHCDAAKNANIVPVDLTVNALIASAWDVANHPERREDDMLIYNFVSSVEAPLTWGEYCETNLKHGVEYPFSTSIWYLSFRMNKSKIMHQISVIILHLLPAILVDAVCISTGNKPRMWKGYQKIHKFTNVIAYFCTREWQFRNDNVQAMWRRLDAKDQQIFKFSMRNFNWQAYFCNYIQGIRVYLMKDDLSTLESSRTKWRRLYWMHQVLKVLIFFMGAWMLRRLFSVFV
ncbi:fatty acyl-CoA reductase wat isoform X2 [Orussus abietinus]|uniref:fatty acyl-CoA reductase wat isoform X2 n=1 Tax=Orussus abietinus TaxID=222816 RepID=UPI0006264E39|nr:fatty acyl-CoA reductase wat isoform X2 [Orussus abietinus]